MKGVSFGVVLGGLLVLSGCDTLGNGTQAGSLMPPQAIVPVKTSPDGNLALTKPQWRVGDEWRYSDDYSLRVTEVTGALTRLRRLDVADHWYVDNGFFREKSFGPDGLRQIVFRSEDPDQFYSQPIGQPLVFVREYLHDKQLLRHQTSWVIESKEKITVPAGTFDTFVIVMRTRSLTGSWTGYERWWYAPAVRNYVRMEYKYGQSPESARVLLSYKLAP